MSSPYCWDCASAAQSHSQEYVENYFKSKGCQLLDTYKNSQTRMKFICKCGEISTITFASLRTGCYCEGCGGRRKLTIDYVKTELSKFNYIIIDKEYINAKTKIKLQCDKGHLCEISWNNFQRGKRCRTCFIENNWNKPEDRKFVLLCRSLLRNCLRRIQLPKTNKTSDLLGYTGQELREHIESHPNWLNVKGEKWHIDHIFPVKAFCDYGIKDIKIINCFENLMPLEGKKNLSKRAKYNKMEFEKWLNSKGMHS
jgi:hypothetical protein